MTDAYLMIQTLGFATGAILFVLLTVLRWKAERLAGEPCYGTALAGQGLLWNVGSLAKCTTLLMGFAADFFVNRLHVQSTSDLVGIRNDGAKKGIAKLKNRLEC